MCRSSPSSASRRGPPSARHYQQEVDLQSLFKDVAGDFVATASVPSQVRHLIDRAVRIASTRRTVTCVILPNDLQELTYEDPPVIHGTTHTGVGYAGPAQLPNDDLLQQAAAVLNAGKKVAILVGAGALGATDEVIAVAREAAGRRGQGAAGQGRAAGRPALGHRIAGPAGDQAVAGT